MSSFMLDAALSYARKGWRVFPLHGIVMGRCTCGKSHEATPKQVGKHPRTRAGFKDATTEFAQITAWWTRWPDTNIGIATGSGLAVIDLDGPAGFDEFKGLVGSHEPIPETLVSKTGNGYHFIFQTREDGPEVRSSARGNVHVRGEGGYIVAPPSLHYSGRRYQWAKCRQLAVMPDWLRQWTQGYEITAPRAVSVLGPLPEYLSSNQRDTTKTLSEALTTVWSPTEQARLESALQAIPSDAYETWFTVGMALQALRWETNDSDLGFQLWDRWSQGTPEKYAPAITEEKWKSFGRSGRQGVTLGTVYHLAQQHGWNGGAPPSGLIDSPMQMNGNHYPLPAALTAQPIHFPDLSEEGKIKSTMLNTEVALLHLGIDCRFDRFHNRNMLGGRIMQQHGVNHLVDDAVIILRRVVRECYGFDPKKENVQDALETLCKRNSFDPVLDYFDSLQWDGVRRLDSWLITYLGAEPTEFNAAAGRLVLIAAVRRARQPGAKFDQILVLEGKEGTGKSQAIKILAGPDNFSDQRILDADDRKQQELTEGVLLYEISELSGHRRAEVEHVKSFASRDEDRARPAYGRYLERRKRRCIFIGTTNRDDYLISDTGNRRFWPVKTSRADLAALECDRNQLWAEACAEHTRGASIVLPERLWQSAADEQEKRVEIDIWLDSINNYLASKDNPESTTTRDVLVGNPLILIRPDAIKRAEYMRAASILKRLGYTKKRRVRTKEGGFEHRYFRE